MTPKTIEQILAEAKEWDQGGSDHTPDVGQWVAAVRFLDERLLAVSRALDHAEWRLHQVQKAIEDVKGML